MAKLWYVTGPDPIVRTPLSEGPAVDYTVDGWRVYGWVLENQRTETSERWARIEIEGPVLFVRGRAWQGNALYKGRMVLTRSILPPQNIEFAPAEEKDFIGFGSVKMLTTRIDSSVSTGDYASAIVVSEISTTPASE